MRNLVLSRAKSTATLIGPANANRWLGRLFTLCALFALPACAFANDISRVLSHYDLSRGFGEIHDQHDKVVTTAARFPIHGRVSVDSLRLRINGKAGDSAVVRIYGHEGGAPAPLVGKVIGVQSTIRKVKNGAEWAVVRFETPIELIGDQFFVCVEEMSGKLALLTDMVEQPPQCDCGGSEQFTFQSVREADGSWKSFSHAFLVDAFVRVEEEQEQRRGFRFSTDTLVTLSTGYAADDTHYLATCDLNLDGIADIVSPAGLQLSVNGEPAWALDTNLSSTVLRVKALVPYRMQNGQFGLIGVKSIESGNETSKTNTIHGIDVHLVEVPLSEVIVSVLVADFEEDKSEGVLVVCRSGRIYKYDINKFGRAQQTRHDLFEGDSTSFLHHAICVDVDGDRDIDVLAAVTDPIGRPEIVYALNNLRRPANSPAVDNDRLFNVSSQQFKRESVFLPPVISANLRPVKNMEDLQAATPSVAVSLVHGAWSEVTGGSSLSVDHTTDLLSTIPYEDRVSSCSWPDLDGDGESELVMTSGDPCRFAKLYHMDHVSGQHIREFSSGLEVVLGAKDICWSDLDNDGDTDGLVWYRGKLIVLWNETQRSMPEPSKLKAGQAIHAISASGLTQMVSKSAGTGWIVHERMEGELVVQSGIDSLWVLHPNGEGSRVSASELLSDGSAAVHNSENQKKAGCQPQVSANPFHTGVAIQGPNATPLKSVTVYADDGSVVWISSSIGPGVYWQGNTTTGVPVAAGVYLLVVETEACSGILRLVKLD